MTKMSSKTRVLIDHSIMTNRSRMQWIKIPLSDGRGGFLPTKLIQAERVQPFKSQEREAEAEAILTVGKLLREKKIEAFNSMELACEGFRDYWGERILDAFNGCEIGNVPNPIERGLFIQTDLKNYIKKGGRKDRAQGESSSSQISFFKWLTELDQTSIDRIITQQNRRNLTDFDIASFKDLHWFKTLHQRLRSDENLPDAFYLWTTRRNQLDVFLTLDFRLINQAAAIEKERSHFRLGFRVESPIQFLKMEGIDHPIPDPFQFQCRYSMSDVGAISSKFYHSDFT